MGLPRFFIEDLAPGELTLGPEESAHARLSRRLAAGDRVAVFDGCGAEAEAVIVGMDRSGVVVRVAEVARRERRLPQLTLGVALPKGPRQDVLIEKCTELGVAGVWVITSERSVSKASDHRITKWRRASIEAAKQSGQSWIPEFHPPVPLWDALRRAADFDRRVVAAPGATRRFNAGGSERIIAFVGPEGGWAPAEEAMFASSSVEKVTLGPNILRIETAAIALAAIVHAAVAGG